LPILQNAEVLEFGAFLTGKHYGFWGKHGFWKDLEKVGPQLTTVRFEVTGRVDWRAAKSVKNLVEARLQGGMPLTRLERMVFEEIGEEWELMGKEREEEAKKHWEKFRAGLDIDRYLAAP